MHKRPEQDNRDEGRGEHPLSGRRDVQLPDLAICGFRRGLMRRANMAFIEPTDNDNGPIASVFWSPLVKALKIALEG
jgi:hypothetical protein